MNNFGDIGSKTMPAFLKVGKTTGNVADETRQLVPTASICRYFPWVGLKMANVLPPAGVNTSLSDNSPRFCECCGRTAGIRISSAALGSWWVFSFMIVHAFP
jgi:hypothetical protein